MTRIPTWRATCTLLALACAFAACASIWGFDDLRVGDASEGGVEMDGTIGEGASRSPEPDGGEDAAASSDGGVDATGGDATAKDVGSPQMDAGPAIAMQDGTTIGDGSGGLSGGEDGVAAGDAEDSTADGGEGPTVGLIAYYAFDETSGTSAADSSGNNRTATLMGGATFSSGLQNNAVTLDGRTGYVSLPSGIVAGLTSFSICAWVNLSGSMAWSRVFDLGTGTTAYMYLTPNSGAGTLQFTITIGGTAQEQQMNAPALATGTWQQVAVTLEANTGTLYVNGAAVAQNTSMTLNPASLGTTTQNWLGRSEFPGDPYLNGQIDNFRIYDRALSAAEVDGLYAGHL